MPYDMLAASVQIEQRDVVGRPARDRRKNKRAKLARRKGR